ncbi:MAG: methyltransferase domain-containing protein [Thermodesulfovibrionia bacterium]|nr:methyltransferase domain-containing protein [Thermodesulfovibrionia bacterium]
MSSDVEAFDKHAGDYDKWFDSAEGKVLFELEAASARLLMKGLEHPFLEIGVGTGRFAEALGIEYGIDPSKEVLKIAEMRGIKAETASGDKLPFKDESFGGVFILFTLCFVENPEKVISEAKRVLKKNGGLIAGIINKESLWGQLYARKKAEGHSIYKYAKFYSVNEVKEMIEKAGLRVDSYSSTLCQPPSVKPGKEVANNRLVKDAGFVCIRADKSV